MIINKLKYLLENLDEIKQLSDNYELTINSYNDLVKSGKIQNNAIKMKDDYYIIIDKNNNIIYRFDEYDSSVLTINEFLINNAHDDNWDAIIPKNSNLSTDIENEINNDFWKSPKILYHATNIEYEQNILNDGLQPRNKTRGISNKSIKSAIFFSEEIDNISSYGDLIFKVNTIHMAKDGFKPFIQNEPDVQRAKMIDKIKYIYTDDDIRIDIENGQEFSTWIVFETIPSKYLSKV